MVAPVLVREGAILLSLLECSQPEGFLRGCDELISARMIIASGERT